MHDDFPRLGQQPLNIADFRRRTASIPCRCTACGAIAPKRRGNPRMFGPQCEALAEDLILKHVADRAYRPSEGRIRGYSTECFHSLDLGHWTRCARLALTRRAAAGPAGTSNTLG